MKSFIYILFFFSIVGVSYANTEIVVDGDSLRIDKKNIRLIYIDAPEYGQFCQDFRGFEYDCGAESTSALKEIIGKRKVDCETIGKDIYNRELSVCYAEGININLEMIKQGWAIVYKFKNSYEEIREYLEAEIIAKEEGKGLWQGKFMKPEFFRTLNRK